MPLISIALADVKTRISNKKTIYNWIEKVIYSERKTPGEVTIILCSDEYLLEMNNRFLKHNYYTDIITFDYCDGMTISGELYISADRVRENAAAFKSSFTDELNRVIIHGVLHLCGYKDKSESDQKRMRKKENEKLLMLKK